MLAAARAAPPEAPLDGDEVLVAHRGVGEGELENPVEHHSASAGAAAVETEHELVRLPLTPVKWIPPSRQMALRLSGFFGVRVDKFIG